MLAPISQNSISPGQPFYNGIFHSFASMMLRCVNNESNYSFERFAATTSKYARPSNGYISRWWAEVYQCRSTGAHCGRLNLWPVNCFSVWINKKFVEINLHSSFREIQLHSVRCNQSLQWCEMCAFLAATQGICTISSMQKRRSRNSEGKASLVSRTL